MSLHKNLVIKHAGNPWLLVIAAISFTFTLLGAQRYVYQPWHRKNKLLEAESYAEFLYKKEK